MPDDVGFIVALMLAAVLAAAGRPSENIVYPRILQSRDQNGERTLYIRRGLVLSLERSRVFSDNFVFSIDDGVNRLDKLDCSIGHTVDYDYARIPRGCGVSARRSRRLDHDLVSLADVLAYGLIDCANFVSYRFLVPRVILMMNGKDLEKNLYQDRNHSSVVFVDEEKGAVQVTGILDNKFSIEPIASSHRSEDDLVAHRLLDLEDIDNPLGDDSVRDLSLSAQDAGLSSSEVTERKLKKLPEEFVVEVRIFSALPTA